MPAISGARRRCWGEHFAVGCAVQDDVLAVPGGLEQLGVRSRATDGEGVAEANVLAGARVGYAFERISAYATEMGVSGSASAQR